MKNEQYGSHKSNIFNMNANSAAMVAYWLHAAFIIFMFVPYVSQLSFFSPLIIFFAEKNSPFVKFHAMQGFLFNVVCQVVSWVFIILIIAFSGVPFYDILINPTEIQNFPTNSIIAILIIFALFFAFSVLVLIYRIVATVKANEYKEFHMPIIGAWSSKIANS